MFIRASIQTDFKLVSKQWRLRPKLENIKGKKIKAVFYLRRKWIRKADEQRYEKEIEKN